MEYTTSTILSTFLRVPSVAPSPDPSPPPSSSSSSTTISAIDILAKIPDGLWVIMGIVVCCSFGLGFYALRKKEKATPGGLHMATEAYNWVAAAMNTAAAALGAAALIDLPAQEGHQDNTSTPEPVDEAPLQAPTPPPPPPYTMPDCEA